MSITLYHAILINAPRSQIFPALTTIEGMNHWHYGHVTGAIEVGSLMNFDSPSGLKFVWKTQEMELNKRLVQVCQRGPGSSQGKILTFNLFYGQEQTLVDLSYGKWLPDDVNLPMCNTYLGNMLFQLKQYIEECPQVHNEPAMALLQH